MLFRRPSARSIRITFSFLLLLQNFFFPSRRAHSQHVPFSFDFIFLCPLVISSRLFFYFVNLEKIMKINKTRSHSKSTEIQNHMDTLYFEISVNLVEV